MNDASKLLKLRITQSMIMVFTVMAIILTVFSAKAFSSSGEEAPISHQNIDKEPPKDIETVKAEEMKFALLAAAIAFGLGAIGAGFAISHVGAAAMGAIAEKPQIASQALIFLVLGEGIMIFGFITALMILGKV